jgi:very-short-patch-repair endonuclease
MAFSIIAAEHQLKDQQRDDALATLGLSVLRFDNRKILLETNAVLVVIEDVVRRGKLSLRGFASPL